MKDLIKMIRLVMVLFLTTIAASVFAAGEHGDGHDEGHAKGHDEGHGDEHGEHEESEKGPHGGRLLTQGDMSVELLLSGHGGSPGYEAWITRHGETVNDQNVVLDAEFERLDGEVLNLGFRREGQSWHGTQPVEEPHSFDVTVGLVVGSEKYQWEFGSYEGRSEIPEAAATKAGVKSEIAGSGSINETVTVYGKVSVDPAKVSHLRARFPGTIVQLDANIGERVKAGQVLAEIESNQNLRHYEILSPMTGVVIARDGNPGELAQTQALLTIANYDTLWVEFQIFPSQAHTVAVGQYVRVFGDQLEASSAIHSILPDQGGQPFLRARVPLENAAGQWAPGLMLSGSIATRQTDVTLRVKASAIQQIDDQDVVFIQSGDAFEARAVTLGLADGEYVEVLDGIRPGVRYVSENSFLIKADLGKSGAAHDH